MRGRGSPSSDEFIREVDEAVRQDKWLALWQRYGSYLVGAALAVVIGTAAGVGWRSYQDSQRQAESQRYAAASQLLQDDRPVDAAKSFDALANDGSSGYAMLARLRAAQAYGAAGDQAAKAEELRRLSEAAADEPLYRDLARLLEIQQTFDEAEPASVIADLDRIAATDQPWRHSALELKALAQLKAGDSKGARATLNALVEDRTTPAGLNQRASELLATLGAPAADQAQGPNADQGGPPQAAVESNAKEATP